MTHVMFRSDQETIADMKTKLAVVVDLGHRHPTVNHTVQMLCQRIAARAVGQIVGINQGHSLVERQA
jgi:hypothetical protein